MSASLRRALLFIGVAVLGLSFNSEVGAQPGSVLVLQNSPRIWQHPFGRIFPPVSGSALPTQQDPTRAHMPGRTWHIADLSNPNLMPWAKELIQKEIAAIDRGKIQFSASSSCFPTATPNFFQDGGPYLFVEARDKIVMIDEAGPVVRHVYLNVPHSPNVKPSWTGESIGWYEGNTLVVDTIGISPKSFVDRFGTPHTEKLHVVERWRLAEQGLSLRVDVTVEDPDTFYKPWKTYQEYARIDRGFQAEICAENNTNLFDYGMPQDLTPDF
jgi:hypothetical protein